MGSLRWSAAQSSLSTCRGLCGNVSGLRVTQAGGQAGPPPPPRHTRGSRCAPDRLVTITALSETSRKGGYQVHSGRDRIRFCSLLVVKPCLAARGLGWPVSVTTGSGSVLPTVQSPRVCSQKERGPTPHGPIVLESASDPDESRGGAELPAVG